jgi:hypothetical protein
MYALMLFFMRGNRQEEKSQMDAIEKGMAGQRWWNRRTVGYSSRATNLAPPLRLPHGFPTI